MKHFTLFWDIGRAERIAGKEFDTAFGDHFTERGVSAGDRVFALAMSKGSLRIVAGMTVHRVLSGKSEIKRERLENADGFAEAIVGRDGTAITLSRIVPPTLALQLEPIGVKPIAPDVAAQLEDLLDVPHIPEEVRGPFIEGAVSRITVNRYERDDKARQACLDHFGMSCMICGFSFGQVYGEQAKDIIHVHHLVPLHTVGERYAVRPLEDLIPVCANCHCVLHLKGGLLTPDYVKELMDAASTRKTTIRQEPVT